MNNGKYHTKSFKEAQSNKLDRMWGAVLSHKKLCQCCEKEFLWVGRKNTKDYAKVRFCSRSCANNRQKVWDNKIKDGESNGKWVRYRQLAFRHHGEKCIVCGFNKIVEVHHLDHDRNNNVKENLVPLCPNHHMMIHRSKFADEILKEIKGYINGL